MPPIASHLVMPFVGGDRHDQPDDGWRPGAGRTGSRLLLRRRARHPAAGPACWSATSRPRTPCAAQELQSDIPAEAADPAKIAALARAGFHGCQPGRQPRLRPRRRRRRGHGRGADARTASPPFGAGSGPGGRAPPGDPGARGRQALRLPQLQLRRSQGFLGRRRESRLRLRARAVALRAGGRQSGRTAADLYLCHAGQPGSDAGRYRSAARPGRHRRGGPAQGPGAHAGPAGDVRTPGGARGDRGRRRHRRSATIRTSRAASSSTRASRSSMAWATSSP
jgi:hypothetical protein